jgi:hypothetical protein
MASVPSEREGRSIGEDRGQASRTSLRTRRVEPQIYKGEMHHNYGVSKAHRSRGSMVVIDTVDPRLDENQQAQK